MGSSEIQPTPRSGSDGRAGGTPRQLVGVVVVHFGDARATLGCLRSIAEDPSPVERRTVVVDNSDNLGGLELPGGPERLSCADNPGFGGGAHRGIEALRAGAEPTLFVILNHDVELLAGFLSAALEAFQEDEVGAAAGPTFMGGTAGTRREGLWYAGGSLNYVTGTVHQSRSPADVRRRRDVSFLPGAALAVRPAAWDQTGGFDPRIFLYNEDVDLSLTMRRQGWRLLFAPGMRSVHHVGSSTGSASASPLYLENLTATRLLPFRSRAYRAYLAALHTGWVLLRTAGLVLRAKGSSAPQVRALLRGHRRALRNLTARRPETRSA